MNHLLGDDLIIPGFSMELDRNALLVYLNELRLLETIIHESEKQKGKLISEMNNLKLDVGAAPRSPYSDICDIESSYRYRKSCLKAFIICLLGSIMGLMMGNVLGAMACVVMLPLSIICLIIYLIYSFQLKGARDSIPSLKEEYEQKLKKYEEEKRNAEYRLSNKKNELVTMDSNISEEINEFKEILQNAYSLNIIPLQFRNIQGIYYLYDYISSSNETLTNALMQANLESIKQKLDQMIELQGTMIIKQAQANQLFFEQNNQILSSLQNVERYSRISAINSRISAINSEISVRLQSKQLAYQVADYFLNNP